MIFRGGLSWIPIVALACAVACDAHPPARACEPLRVMPLGDSITEADEGRASYRYWLHRAFERAGRPVDFVGSRTGVYRGKPLHEDFDQDHEGHWGWTTADVRRQIDAWAARYVPDVVLLLLGTNDGARDLRATTENLTAIVESLRAHRPGVAVFLAQVPPVANRVGPGIARDIALLNAALDALAQALDEPAARVFLVDQWTGFDAERDSYDGIHPSESGEQKLATRWFDAIEARIPFDARGCAGAP